uniref:Uncharacterized protein n=1 Tax=Physcomitrium patens TaxID=3218 RepID=A0A2K1J4X9_PHYPA|nr:hypothetical protein PHYPA_022434 [Physcomitrium patens]
MGHSRFHHPIAHRNFYSEKRWQLQHSTTRHLRTLVLILLYLLLFLSTLHVIPPLQASKLCNLHSWGDCLIHAIF